MANPKHKISRMRTRRRRANDFLKPINLNECPNCKSPKQPHHICMACGYYNGRQIVKPEEEK